MDAIKLIDKISKGDKQDIKEAIRHIEKLRILGKNRYPPEYKELLSWAIENFDDVENPANQVAVLKALQLPLICLGSRDYESCSGFLLRAFQNSDGRVREQAYHAANWFLIEITPDSSPRKKEKTRPERKTKQFIDFIIKINTAAEKHKYEAGGLTYLNSMKSCVYKSLQKFLRRIITNEWLLDIVHEAGYVESPSHSEIFGDDSSFWEVAPELELHEVEFTMRIKKGKNTKC